jgi:hypothetical protein
LCHGVLGIFLTTPRSYAAVAFSFSHYQKLLGYGKLTTSEGGVSNVDIDGKNTLQIKAIGATISTFETLPSEE